MTATQLPLPGLVSLVFLLIVLATSAPIQLDIHLPLRSTDGWRSGCPFSEALRSNLALIQSSDPENPTSADGVEKWTGEKEERINFFRRHSPHSTLYLTEFDVGNVVNGTSLMDETKLQSLLGAIRNATSSLHRCDVELTSEYAVSGPYAMWTVNRTACLRVLSDAVVAAASPYMHRPPSVPDWVRRLPEPERTRRLQLIRKYGSPNVFDMFDPHVTVGYDTVTPRERREAVMEGLAANATRPCTGTVVSLRLGRTGVGGTVLQNGTVGGDVPLPPTVDVYVS